METPDETAADQQPETGDDATAETLPAEQPAHGPRRSLPHRAPIEPFTKQELTVRLSRDLRGAEYSEVIRQENQCIRSRVRVICHSLTHGGDGNVDAITAPIEPAPPRGSSSDFPYPADYREVTQRHYGDANADEEDTVGQGNTNNTANGGNDRWRVFEIARHLGISPTKLFKVLRQAEPPRRRRHAKADRSTLEGYQLQVERQQAWSYGFQRTADLDISVARTVGKSVEVVVRPVYLVVGIFPRGGHSHHPLEMVVFVARPEKLFWRLRRAVFRLRGWQGTFLSLRHVRAFGLYQCDRTSGNHRRVELDDNGLADLQLFLETYNRHWYGGVPSELTLAWAAWIHQTLNNGSHHVEEGTYALELVLDWSVARITFVVLLPVLLSLAVGVWLNSRDWTDLATIQTAWGTASYVVTAGGLMAALLAIASGLGDK